jgi:hypothetical protein
VADDNWHNRNDRFQNSGEIVQSRDVHGDLTINSNRNAGRFVAIGGVLALVGALTTWIVLRPHEQGTPQAAPLSSTAPSTQDAIRLAGEVRIDESAFDKVIPSGDLKYEDVVGNVVERRPTTKTPKSEWLAAHGAVGVDEARWNFGLDGLLDHAVQITEVRPVDLECGEPLGGTYLSDPAQGSLTEYLTVDFDEREPRFLISAPEAGQPPVPLFDRKVNLTKGATQSFVLIARSTKQHCRFRVGFEYTANGVQQQFVVDDNGKPFEVTGKASPDKYAAAYLPGLMQCQVSYKVPYSHLGTGQPC